MKFFPTLSGKWINLNLNYESLKSNLDLSHPDICEKWIKQLLEEKNADYIFGGFLEDRTYIWRNHPNEKAESLIHLGIDYSVPAGVEIVLPLDGELIHVMKDPLNKIGWGGRLIFKLIDGNYLLFGHLDQNIKLKIGKNYKKGEIVGIVGKKEVNGNWWPHLHAQLMTQKFIANYLDNLDLIDGYLPVGNENIKNILDPESNYLSQVNS